MWQWDRRVQALALLLAAALVFACGIRYASWQAGRDRLGTTDQVCVQVVGAVSKPGVYYFPRGTRVNTAVQKAEPIPNANLNALNLAQQLTDGVQIEVPGPGEVAKGTDGSAAISQGGTAQVAGVQGSQPSVGSNNRSPSSGNTASTSGKVNINTASVAELDRLPGIGTTYAQRIIDYRTTHGPFRTIDDLQNVSGIGPKRFEQLKDLVTNQ